MESIKVFCDFLMEVGKGSWLKSAVYYPMGMGILWGAHPRFQKEDDYVFRKEIELP